MTDYTMVLKTKFADKDWAIHGGDYETLEWFNDSPVPSRDQLDALWPETEAALAATVDARASALAKLQALGLTEEEALALVGG